MHNLILIYVSVCVCIIVSYASQRSSFLTGNIFQQWIWELERRVEYPCVLLLDTSPAHVSVRSPSHFCFVSSVF